MWKFQNLSLFEISYFYYKSYYLSLLKLVLILSDHMSAICGEKVHTHMYLQNTQMNVGKVGLKGPVDQWHFDSVQYVCVCILRYDFFQSVIQNSIKMV